MTKETLEEFEAYVEPLAQGLVHAGRRMGLHGCCSGGLSAIAAQERRADATYLDPLRVSARYEALHHFMAKADRSDVALM
jgi:hypothetical protein